VTAPVTFHTFNSMKVHIVCILAGVAFAASAQTEDVTLSDGVSPIVSATQQVSELKQVDFEI
jgi:hypothetical protein